MKKGRGSKGGAISIDARGGSGDGGNGGGGGVQEE